MFNRLPHEDPPAHLIRWYCEECSGAIYDGDTYLYDNGVKFCADCMTEVNDDS